MRIDRVAVVALVVLLTLTPATAVASPPAKVVCDNATKLEKDPGTLHPVVLVHGWNSDAEAMDSVAAAVAAKLESRTMTYSFDYHKNNDNWAADDQVAGCLAAVIDAIAKASIHAGGNGRVLLVGHSMGGLAIRYASQRSVDGRNVASRIGGVITLDTPHEGSFWGGTWYARLIATLGVFPREWAPLPPSTSDAARCLTHHSGGDSFPKQCGTAPPYLPETAGILQIAGQVSITRTFLDIPLYTYALDGDSIVDTSSERGYIGSGPTKQAAYGPVAMVGVECTIKAGQILDYATARKAPFIAKVIEGIADLGIDNAAMDDVLASKVGPATAAMLMVAKNAADCGHTSITSNAQALKATVDQLTTWLDAMENPLLAYTEWEGLTVLRGTKPVANASGGDCGAKHDFYRPPIWTRNGRFVASVWTKCEDVLGPSDDTDNIVFVIDSWTGQKRQFTCGCTQIAAVDGSRVAWVDDHAKLFTADLAGTAGGIAWQVQLPAGMYARQAAAGVGGMVLIQATLQAPGPQGYSGRQESGPGAALLVDPSGKPSVINNFPELVSLYPTAATASSVMGGPRFVYNPVLVLGDCAHPGGIWIVDPATGKQTQTNTSALSTNGADVFMRDAWWSYDGQLYATLHSAICDPEGGAIQVMPSLWRLDGNRWNRVSDEAVNFVRQYGPALKMVVDDGGILFLEKSGKRTKIISQVFAVESPPLAQG